LQALTQTMLASSVQPPMTVLIDKRDGYRVITLNRPERLNAFNIALHEALAAAIDEAAADETCRALLITGAGRAFCSGQDLHDRVMKPGHVAAKAGEALLKHYNPLLRKIRELPMPVVAAVNGVAAGAGCNFALAADIVLAARSATFIEAFARIGLIPDVGGTFFLPRLAGMARARGMALLAETITAEQAEQWGLIWKVCEDDKLMSDAEAMCAKFAKAPTFALGLTKRALDASATNDLDAQLQLEYELQKLAGSSPDYAEGVRAFLEKRKPNFTGAKAKIDGKD
jgi:2-(1,2-epoxy-1,2-dihydrophenyl)acetyl-CoA isomerase